MRAGEIANPQVLIDDAPPTGIVYHRVPLAEINWTGRQQHHDQRHDRGLPQALPAAHQPEDLLHVPGRRRRVELRRLQLARGSRGAPARRRRRAVPAARAASRQPDARRPAQRHDPRLRAALAACCRAPRRARSRSSSFVDCIGIEIRDLDLLTYDGIGGAHRGPAGRQLPRRAHPRHAHDRAHQRDPRDQCRRADDRGQPAAPARHGRRAAPRSRSPPTTC